MNESYSETGQTLVLSDDAGNYYAIPVTDLEQYRVSDEQKDNINESLGDDVAGFIMNPMYSAFVNQHHATQHQGDLARSTQASRVRDTDATQQAQPDASQETPQRAPILRRVFTGVLSTIKF